MRRGRCDAATERLHATNQLSRVHRPGLSRPLRGRVRAGVGRHAHHGELVTIKRIEQAIADAAWRRTSSTPCARRYGRQERRSRRIGSGGVGRGTAAHPAGHEVTVYERDDRLGGFCGTASPSSSSRRGSSNDAFPRCAWRDAFVTEWRSCGPRGVGSAGALRCSGARHRRAASPATIPTSQPGPRRGAPGDVAPWSRRTTSVREMGDADLRARQARRHHRWRRHRRRLPGHRAPPGRAVG